MLRLTVDRIFPRKCKDFSILEPNIYKVPGYSDTENMWELLCQIGILRVQTDTKVAYKGQ